MLIYSRVLKEYEKSIGNFEDEIETLTRQIMKGEEERIKIAQEQDYALEDLRQAEFAFSDLHRYCGHYLLFYFVPYAV